MRRRERLVDEEEGKEREGGERWVDEEEGKVGG